MERKYKMRLKNPPLPFMEQQMVGKYFISNSGAETGVIRFTVTQIENPANPLFEIRNDASGDFILSLDRKTSCANFLTHSLPLIKYISNTGSRSVLELSCEDDHREVYPLQGKGALFQVVHKIIEELRDNMGDVLKLGDRMREIKTISIFNNIAPLLWRRGGKIIIGGIVGLRSFETLTHFLSEWLARSSEGEITPEIVKEVFYRLPFSSQDDQNHVVH